MRPHEPPAVPWSGVYSVCFFGEHLDLLGVCDEAHPRCRQPSARATPATAAAQAQAKSHTSARTTPRLDRHRPLCSPPQTRSEIARARRSACEQPDRLAIRQSAPDRIDRSQISRTSQCERSRRTISIAVERVAPDRIDRHRASCARPCQRSRRIGLLATGLAERTVHTLVMANLLPNGTSPQTRSADRNGSPSLRPTERFALSIHSRWLLGYSAGPDLGPDTPIAKDPSISLDPISGLMYADR